MGLTMEMRKGFAREKAKRYRQGSKKKKGQLIEEYMELVGCTRHHAAWTLRCWGITVWEQHAGRPVKIVVGRRRSRQRTARIYDQQTVAALTKLWRHFGYLCGKRLAATLRLWLPHYEGWNARSKRKIALTPEVRAKLLRISPATIDRLLRAEKRKLSLRGLSHTKKPTGTLMLQIPIRTFSEWHNVPVGTLGMDLVGHDGGSAQGEFAYTLLATDRCTQWTEMRAVPNKAQKWVFEQLLVVRRLLPFELLGVHSDNGGEFINAHLQRYCEQQQIDFTRSRAHRKNDNTVRGHRPDRAERSDRASATPPAALGRRARQPAGAGWLMRRSAAELASGARAPRGCPRPRQVASGTDLQALIRHPGAATVPIGACSRSLPNGRSQLPLPRLVRSRDSAMDGVAASGLRECSRGSAEADSM